MRKSYFLMLFAALLALPMSAQISRSGNKYFADGMVMNKTSFAAYMQQNAEAALASKFKSGLTIANVGWGLFGGGLAINTAGFITICATGVNIDKSKSASEATSLALGGSATAATLYLIGSSITTAGIVCLGVGYGRMHKTADNYAFISNSNRQRPQAYITLQTSKDGLGLAVKF